jgi:signal transduction histidine kinase
MVVELHHGEVIVESLEGVGSTFIVRLPVRASAVNEHAPESRSMA